MGYTYHCLLYMQQFSEKVNIKVINLIGIRLSSAKTQTNPSSWKHTKHPWRIYGHKIELLCSIFNERITQDYWDYPTCVRHHGYRSNGSTQESFYKQLLCWLDMQCATCAIHNIPIALQQTDTLCCMELGTLFVHNDIKPKTTYTDRARRNRHSSPFSYSNCEI